MGKFRFLILFFSLTFFVGCFPNYDEKHKKDEELITNFQSHKEEFNQLLQIILEECKTSQSSKEGFKLSGEKLAKYKHLSKEIGLPNNTMGNCLKNGVEFVDSVQGLAVSGSSKGFAFLKNKPEILVDNLDSYSHTTLDSYTAFRNIESNWYLYFEYDN